MLGRIAKWLLDTSDDDVRRLSSSEVRDGVRKCVLVLDASVSMFEKDWPPTRLEAAKEAATSFCSRLASESPDSQIAIVAYGTKASIYSHLTPARNTRSLLRAMDKIKCLGSTNIEAGLSKASEILGHSQRLCQVVLLTDGHNTEKSPRPIAKILRTKALVECVGIGGSPDDVDETLLKDIASEYPDGKKRYRWIGDKERLVKHFHELAGRISRT